jgi:hypothetical protein
MRTYVILNSSDIDTVDFSKVLQQSASALRYSVDGSKFLLKFEGDTPSFLIGEPQYDHSEILPIMQSAEWKADEI